VKRAVRILLIVLGVLLLLLFVGPLLAPVRPLDTVPPRELADPDSRFVAVEVRGVPVEVHTKLMGQGEPAIVLLHGFASSTYTWRHIMEPLSAVGTVLALDWMPYGLTERAMPGAWHGAENNPYRREAQAEMVFAVMDAYGIDQAILVGNSAGGALAGLMASQQPERVSGLVLVDAAIFVKGGDRRGGGRFGLLGSPLARAVGSTPQMRRIGPLLVRGIQEWGNDFGREAWHDPTRITEEMWAEYRKPLQADNWDRGLYEAVIAPPQEVDVLPRLQELALPTLVVTGDDDRTVPTENSIRLAAALPGAELAVFEACGHAPQEECPDALLAAMQGFLDDIEE
jgi:pimeloyl-ACP methyl ester carboxylesterase